MPPNDLQTLIDRLSPTIDSKPRIITLARLGSAAIPATSRLLQIGAETPDYMIRICCLDALYTILADSCHPTASQAAYFLSTWLDQPRFRKVRRSTAFTIARIGSAAHPALPALIQLHHRGAYNSVRKAVDCAISTIIWKLLRNDAESDQRIALHALSQIRDYYAAWILHDFLNSGLGSASIRAAAHAAYTRPDQKHRIESLQDW